MLSVTFRRKTTLLWVKGGMHMDDPQIVELYWQRSDRAIAETEQKYGAYCRRIAYSICENLQDAEECVSDAWLAAWTPCPTSARSV